MLNITISKSFLQDDQNGQELFCFRSKPEEVFTTDSLIKSIVNYNSTVTEADVRGVITILTEKLIEYVQLGYKVELPFGEIYLVAKGTTTDIHQGFEPGNGNHRLEVKFNLDQKVVEEMIKSTSYEVKKRGFYKPEINTIRKVLDNGKESNELTFKVGDIIRIKGERTSFDYEDEKQGIFLVSSSAERLRLPKYSRIGSNIVDAFIPDSIAAADYTVSLVSKRSAAESYTRDDSELAVTVSE